MGKKSVKKAQGICGKEGCNQPRQMGYVWCEAHRQAYGREAQQRFRDRKQGVQR